MANLLTPEYKKKIKRRAIYKLFIVYILGLSVIMALVALLLIPSYMLVESKRLTAEKNLELLRNSVTARENKEFEKLLNETSLKIEALEPEETFNYYEIIGNIVDSEVGSIDLESFSFSENDEIVTVGAGGFAASRSDLLAFKDELERIGVFEEVVLPISVLAKDRDINFTIQLKFNKKSLI